MWGPGDGYAGIDELLVQFDPQRRPLYIAQDGSGDVVAAFDLRGPGVHPQGADPQIPTTLFVARRVWQASYDPYGQVIAARTEHAHDPLWAGHKGLFVERLDAGVMDGLPGLPTGLGGGSGIDLPRLEPGSTLIAHARNRWLLTRWGIWGSMDPNASGQGVVGAAVFGGRAQDLSPVFSSLDAQFGDGAHLFAAYTHDPLGQSDALGLFIPGIGPLDTLEMGLEIGMLAYDLVSEYSANLDFDVDWALDWSMGDDMHSRSGVWGSAHDDVGQSDAGSGVGYDQANVWKSAARIAGRATGVVGKFEKHHALPRYIAKWMNQGVSKLIFELTEDIHRVGKNASKTKELYHKGLDKALKAAGVPPMTHPKPGKAWQEFIQKAGGHANAKAIVQRTIEEYTRGFCAKSGITNADEWIDVIRRSW